MENILKLDIMVNRGKKEYKLIFKKKKTNTDFEIYKIENI